MTHFVEGGILWQRKGVQWGCNLENMAARIRNTYHLNIISISLVRKELHLPRLKEIDDIFMLVDAAIVHHNDQIWGREWLHLIKGMFHELIKCFSIKSAFNNVTMEDTFFKGQCRKYQVSSMEGLC